MTLHRHGVRSVLPTAQASSGGVDGLATALTAGVVAEGVQRDDGREVGVPAEASADLLAWTRRAVTHVNRHGDFDIDQVLRSAVVGLGEAVPVATVGVTVREPDGRIRAVAAGGELLERLQHAQIVLREGPAVDGLDGPVWIEDLQTAAGRGGRWARFAPEALRLGVHAVLSLPLPTSDWTSSGSLQLYAAAPGAFDERVRLLAEVYAERTAVAVDHSQRVETLLQAVRSRDVEGQAKGILMQRHGTDAAGASTMLLEAARASDMEVVDVAAWLIGDLPHRSARSGTGQARADRPTRAEADPDRG